MFYKSNRMRQVRQSPGSWGVSSDGEEVTELQDELTEGCLELVF